MTGLWDLSRDIAELTPSVIALRRELHRRPELAFEEVWTAATLASRMRALGLWVVEAAVVNDDQVTGAVERAARRVIGQANIITKWRNRFSDDFGLFLAAAPGCLMLLGTGNPDRGITESWHRPGFDIDEDALALGVHIMSLAVLELLGADEH